jgi:hypothetical protein
VDDDARSGHSPALSCYGRVLVGQLRARQTEFRLIQGIPTQTLTIWRTAALALAVVMAVAAVAISAAKAGPELLFV